LPEEDASTGVNTSLTLLPHLLHTAFLSLLSASIPLSTTLTSVLVAYPSSTTKDSAMLLSPTANKLLRAKPIRSIHVFAFSGDRRLLLNESDGKFSYKEWEEACELAEEVCCEEDEGGVSLGDSMDIDGAVQSQNQNLEKWLREVVRRKVQYEQRWKTAT
jgi:exosome complex component RRP46